MKIQIIPIRKPPLAAAFFAHCWFWHIEFYIKLEVAFGDIEHPAALFTPFFHHIFASYTNYTIFSFFVHLAHSLQSLQKFTTMITMTTLIYKIVKRPRILAFLHGIASFMLYARLMPHNIFPGDSTELIAAIASNGVAHPPGYPLFVLLGHI